MNVATAMSEMATRRLDRPGVVIDESKLDRLSLMKFGRGANKIARDMLARVEQGREGGFSGRYMTAGIQRQWRDGRRRGKK